MGLSFQTPFYSQNVADYCQKIDQRFIHYGWGLSQCQDFDWMYTRKSYLGDPLIWLTFGDEVQHRKFPKNSTLIMCGVHGDEITPIKFCFDIIHYLTEMQDWDEMQDFFKERLIIVAPIVSPDSFFITRPTRTNARGVDLNRNFPTRDWDSDALSTWRNRYRSDPRRYPGEEAFSESETHFQVDLIRRYRPDKIISVHAPLTILDYDGPKLYDDDVDLARLLLDQMAKDAKNYRVMDWPYFPGSLGNWAGNEKAIPTYTLELPSSDNRNHHRYWGRFRQAIHTAIEFSMTPSENSNENHSAN